MPNKTDVVVSAAPPEGMVEVPVEPTEEMYRATVGKCDAYGFNHQTQKPCLTFETIQGLWQAMIAARPAREQIIEEAQINAIATRAQAVITQLCNGEITWTMSVPARPDDDPDLILSAAISDLQKAAIRALSAAPNNAPQQRYFAAAREGGPDLTPSDRGTLLPCPFCGGEAKMHGASYMTKFPACVDCGAERGSVELWNTRATDGLQMSGDELAQSPDARDAKRLDWLEQHLFSGRWDGTIGVPKTWSMAGPYRHTLQKMHGNTLREAVDAAMGSPTDDEERK